MPSARRGSPGRPADLPRPRRGMPRRVAAGEGRHRPAAADHPGAIRVRGRVRADRRLVARRRSRSSFRSHAIAQQAAADRVDVRVLEAGEERLAVEADDRVAFRPAVDPDQGRPPRSARRAPRPRRLAAPAIVSMVAPRMTRSAAPSVDGSRPALPGGDRRAADRPDADRGAGGLLADDSGKSCLGGRGAQVEAPRPSAG